MYYHFIEKFDYSDQGISMSKDGDSLHVHQSNVQKESNIYGQPGKEPKCYLLAGKIKAISFSRTDT